MKVFVKLPLCYLFLSPRLVISAKKSCIYTYLTLSHLLPLLFPSKFILVMLNLIQHLIKKTLKRVQGD